jgi:hypothetical protein
MSANTRLTNSNGIFVDAGINAEYSKNSRDYGGALTVGYRW